MRKISLVMCLLFMFSVSVCSARTSEWKSSYYDFSKIKVILLLGPFIGKEVEDQFAVQITCDLLAEQLKKRKVPIILERQLAEIISNDIGIDLVELSKTDYNKYVALLKEHGPKYIDAVLVINVHKLGYTQQYEEGYSIPYQSTQTSSFFGNNSYGGHYSGTITTPSTDYINVRGGYRDFATAGYSMALYDNNLNVVWGFSDVRSHRLRGFSKSKPDDVLKRIMNTAFDKAPVPQTKEK